MYSFSWEYKYIMNYVVIAYNALLQYLSRRVLQIGTFNVGRERMEHE